MLNSNFPKIKITALDYLLRLGLINNKNVSEWVSVKCPVHKSGAEANPSLRINTKHGYFRCMACNISGGDLIALHRFVTGKSFKDAITDLERI